MRYFGVAGTTSLRLGVVVLCLSIILMSALPYYFHLQAQAKRAGMHWLASSIRTMVLLVRTQAMLSQSKGGNHVVIENPLGKKIKVSINALLNPTATAEGIVTAVEIPDRLQQIEVSFEGSIGAQRVIYHMKGTAQCKILYREDLLSGVIAIREDISDCS